MNLSDRVMQRIKSCPLCKGKGRLWSKKLKVYTHCYACAWERTILPDIVRLEREAESHWIYIHDPRAPRFTVDAAGKCKHVCTCKQKKGAKNESK